MNDNKFHEFHEIFNFSKDKSNVLVDLDAKKFKEALLKLNKDGNIRIETIQKENRIFKSVDISHKYFITFEGILFLSNGGYKSFEENKIKENDEIKLLKQQQKQLEKKNLILTVLIAIGALVAAVYYLIEIYKYFF